MSLLTFLFGRRQRAAARSIGPSHEDVDLEPLGLGSRTPAEQKKKGGAKPLTKGAVKPAAGKKVEPVAHDKIDPGVSNVRPPAAIPVSAEELARIQAGEGFGPGSEKDALLQQLNEVGFNLKKMMSIVEELQEVVANDYESLSDGEKVEAINFVGKLRAIVVKEVQPEKQAA